jgi:hypothetical protein
MLHNPPTEKEWRSWLWVGVWSLIIYLTIPFARRLQAWVQDGWGRDAFTIIVISILVAASALAIGYLYRAQGSSIKNYAWLVGTTGLFIFYTLQLGHAPEEALHFVEYGVLGLLIYRAFTHRIRDFSVYYSAAVLGAIIGILDETIQWLTPQRYWGYRDIWLNFVAVALVQVGIAKGLAPTIISIRAQPRSIRLLAKLSMIALFLLGMSLINTPTRVEWYAERLPGLAFLKNNPSTMSEYGYLYRDPEVGVFRSRLSPQALRETDRVRAKEAAAILNAYQDGARYAAFLSKYTPSRDAFVHEARVHLFRRDSFLQSALGYRDDVTERRLHLTIAYRENKIMEKYFPQTLRHSRYVLPAEVIAQTKREQLPELVYDSAVSQHLITRMGEPQLLAIIFLAITAVGLGIRFTFSEK